MIELFFLKFILLKNLLEGWRKSIKKIIKDINLVIKLNIEVSWSR